MPTIINIAFIALLAGPAAQQPAKPARLAQHPAFNDTAFSKLALTVDQRNVIRKLERQYAKRLRSLGPASKERVDALHAERIVAVKRILTPDQYRHWRQLSPSELPYAEMPLLPASLLVMPTPDSGTESEEGRMPVLKPDERPRIQ